MTASPVPSDRHLDAHDVVPLGRHVDAGIAEAFLLTETRYFPARLGQTAPPKRQKWTEPGSYSIIDLDLSKYDSATIGMRVSMSREARARFLEFAASPDADWPGNFRDFNGAVVRMATMAAGGRITIAEVDDEIRRLRQACRAAGEPDRQDASLAELLGAEAAGGLDPFDRVQLAEVVRICRASRTLSDAGRRLFAASRARKSAPISWELEVAALGVDVICFSPLRPPGRTVGLETFT